MLPVSTTTDFMYLQLVTQCHRIWHDMCLPGDPKKMIPLIVLICQFKRKSSIKDLFNGIVAKHLEVICAKDGRYIFINKNVMSISVKHDFQDNIYKFQQKCAKGALRYNVTKLWQSIFEKVVGLSRWNYWWVILYVSAF